MLFRSKQKWNNLSDEEREQKRKQFSEVRKLASGSTGKTWKHSEETISKYRKPKSKEHCERISAALKVQRVGKGNPSYGSIWITNDIDTKKIRKDEIIPNGWRLGRAFKTRKSR